MGSYEKIVETLRRCAKEIDCDGCPYYHEDGYWCDQKSIATDAADAIETLLSTNAWNEQAVNHLKGEVDKVVHCKDCKWYSIYEAKKDGTPDKRYSPSVCLRGTYAKRRDPDWYCADGEREVQE